MVNSVETRNTTVYIAPHARALAANMDDLTMGTKLQKAADSAKGIIRAENEKCILDAAEHVFAERGFTGATTAEIALRAQVPKANLHYYFPTKEKLYRRLIERLAMIWMDAASSLDENDDPGEALARYIGAKMDLARKYPSGSRVFASEIMHGAPIMRDYIETTLLAWLNAHTAVVQRWISEGKLRPMEPKYLFYMIWATTQHYADFDVQIALLNTGTGLSDTQFAIARAQAIAIIVKGVMP